jgi:hypothetical protein
MREAMIEWVTAHVDRVPEWEQAVEGEVFN